ncbi:Ankyrin-2 [Gryllus bimaculatus]|nr:Ankyrin-2 [Gryllus bimaculatus]
MAAACDAYDENAALLVAAERGRVGCVLGVVDEGSSRNESSGTTVSALTVAAQRGHVGYVRALLTAAGAVGAAGAAAAEEDEDGWTALHWAAHWGHAAGGVVDGGSGWRPLHCAARGGHCACAGELLRAGADPRRRAANGARPVDVAAGEDVRRESHELATNSENINYFSNAYICASKDTDGVVLDSEAQKLLKPTQSALR